MKNFTIGRAISVIVLSLVLVTGLDIVLYKTDLLDDDLVLEQEISFEDTYSQEAIACDTDENINLDGKEEGKCHIFQVNLI